MAENFNFTFQNLNPTTTGWTSGSIEQTLADLRNTPFDPLDTTEIIDDTTASDPTGGGTEILNLAQGQGMLKSVDQVLKNLQKAASKAPDLDTLKYYNEQILEAQKEQQRIQGEVVKFGGSASGAKKDGGGSNGLLTAFGVAHGLPFLGKMFGSDKPLTPAQKAELLTKRVAKADSKLDIEQDKLDASTSSVESLQTAIANATDPKIIGNLQKQLATEQKKLSKDQAKFDAQTAHRTQLQNKLVAINPPAAGTPAVIPGDTAGTTPGTTPAVKAPNYWDQLVDKALGTRAGASGWHSGYVPPVVEPIVDPAVVPTKDLALQTQGSVGINPAGGGTVDPITGVPIPGIPATTLPPITPGAIDPGLGLPGTGLHLAQQARQARRAAKKVPVASVFQGVPNQTGVFGSSWGSGLNRGWSGA